MTFTNIQLFSMGLAVIILGILYVCACMVDDGDNNKDGTP